MLYITEFTANIKLSNSKNFLEVYQKYGGRHIRVVWNEEHNMWYTLFNLKFSESNENGVFYSEGETGSFEEEDSFHRLVSLEKEYPLIFNDNTNILGTISFSAFLVSAKFSN